MLPSQESSPRRLAYTYKATAQTARSDGIPYLDDDETHNAYAPGRGSCINVRNTVEHSSASHVMIPSLNVELISDRVAMRTTGIKYRTTYGIDVVSVENMVYAGILLRPAFPEASKILRKSILSSAQRFSRVPIELIHSMICTRAMAMDIMGTATDIYNMFILYIASFMIYPINSTRNINT